jgi:recombinational DNA repair ATPase RecF
MKVLQLTVENFCNLFAVDITPTPHMVLIEGKNEQGKSNVINSIFWNLLGAKGSVPEPVREGASEARVTVKLGEGEEVELIVTRRQTAKGMSLEITDAQGHVIKQPQALLSGLVSTISFDPTVFIRERADKRKELLLDICGVRTEIAAIETERTRLYNLRHDRGKEVKTLQVQMDAVPLDIKQMERSEVIDNPDDLIQAKIKENQEKTNAINAARQQLRNFEIAESTLQNQCAAVDHDNEALALEIRRLEVAVDEAKKALQAGLKKHDEYGELIDNNRQEVEQQLSIIVSLPQPEDVSGALAQAAEQRRKAEAWNNYRKTHDEANLKQQEHEKLDLAVSECDLKKTALLKSRLDGLGLDMAVEIDENDELKINGRNFDSHSTAGQLKISAALAMSSNPKLRIMRVTHGSELDETGMQVLLDMAKQHDFDVWVERVSDKPGTGIFIEEGRIIKGATE